MKVNDPNLQGTGGLTSASNSAGAATGVSKPTGRPARAGGAVTDDGSDGVALSGLAQTLRALDVESPERQAQVESLARTYAQGNYQVDAEATAAGIITDAVRHK